LEEKEKGKLQEKNKSGVRALHVQDEERGNNHKKFRGVYYGKTY